MATEETTEEKAVKSKKQPVKLADAGTEVQFKSNGKSKHMPKDEIYTVSAESANIFIELNYGQIID